MQPPRKAERLAALGEELHRKPNSYGKAGALSWDSGCRRFVADAPPSVDSRGRLVVPVRAYENGRLLFPRIEAMTFWNPPLSVYGQAGAYEDHEIVLRRITEDAYRVARHGSSPVTIYADPTNLMSALLSSADNVYANARSGSNLGVDTGWTSYGYCGQLYYEPNPQDYTCFELVFQWDTGSAIEDTATVTVATASMYAYFQQRNVTQTHVIAAHNWGPSITTADWVAGASLTGLTTLASKVFSSDPSTAAYTVFDSDAGFPAQVNLTGMTQVLMYSSRHAAGNTPTGSERIYWYGPKATGTTYDPKVYVEYSMPATGNPAYYYAQQ